MKVSSWADRKTTFYILVSHYTTTKLHILLRFCDPFISLCICQYRMGQSDSSDDKILSLH